MPACRSSHSGVAKVAFTGSVATGRMVNLAAAQNLRPATMELVRGVVCAWEPGPVEVTDNCEW